MKKFINTPITISERAAEYLFSIMQEYEVPNLQKQKDLAIIGLRLSTKEAGCVGFKYDLTHSNGVEGLDEVMCYNVYNKEWQVYKKVLEFYDFYHKCDKQNYLILILDGKSFFRLLGLHIDYETNNFSKKLVFSNKNASNQCGCGESFGF